MLHLLGVADLDTISKFEVQISSEPGSFIFPTRIATFESTIMDITSSYRLELIKPLGIRNSLIKKIENASQAVEYRDLAAAKNILNAFKNEVRAQSSKDITETAAQILLEDADYLISRLQ
jgi:hypothetical protein